MGAATGRPSASTNETSLALDAVDVSARLAPPVGAYDNMAAHCQLSATLSTKRLDAFAICAI